MFAIASLLDPASDQAVNSLWERFPLDCGLAGVQVTPLPHFSWMSAEAMELDQVEDILARTATQFEPFTVTTSGLGIFTGKEPVVYIALVKNAPMLHLHRLIWDQVAPYASDLNLHYEPDRWVPHITLAYHAFEAKRLGCAIADAAFQEIRLKIHVDHLSLIYQTGEEAGIRRHFAFRECSPSTD